MKKALSLLLALSMVFALVACGEKTPDPTPDNPGADDSTQPSEVSWPSTMQRLSMGTGGTTGAYYIIGAGLCSVISDNATNIDITAEVTGATLDNIAMVANYDCELGIANADFAQYAVEGTETYKESGPLDILGICSLYPTTTHIVASKSSGINSLEDMKGKRISVGPYGSGNRMGSERLLDMVGISFDDIEVFDLTNAEAIESLKDGVIDAFILYSGYPLSSIIELTSTTDVNWISLDDDFIGAFVEKYPYYMKITVPADVYDTPNDISCVGVNNIMITNSTVDEDIIYLITKTLYSNLDSVHTVHTQAAEITLESATNVSIPLHPGAEKYFKEVGLL